MVDDKRFAMSVEEIHVNGWQKAAVTALILQIVMWISSDYGGSSLLVLSVWLAIMGFISRK